MSGKLFSILQVKIRWIWCVPQNLQMSLWNSGRGTLVSPRNIDLGTTLADNIKMIKGVHQLTLRLNMLISLIDQFTIFNGWKDGQKGWPMGGSRIFCRGRGGGPGRTARIQDLHMGPIPTYLPTYLCMNRQAHKCLRTGRRIDIQHVDV